MVYSSDTQQGQTADKSGDLQAGVYQLFLAERFQQDFDVVIQRKGYIGKAGTQKNQHSPANVRQVMQNGFEHNFYLQFLI